MDVRPQDSIQTALHTLSESSNQPKLIQINQSSRVKIG